MSRKSEFQSVSEKPAVKYLEWNSESGKFRYYDKEKKQNVAVDLPKFLTLMQFHTVKGWNDASESGIYSNEVKMITSEEMEVKAFKGGTIAKGFYKEIKDKVVQAGGHYVKSLYIMVEGGEVWNLQIKGAVVQQWGDTFNKCMDRLADEWITIDKVEKKKKGRVEYTVPVFKFEGVISNSESVLADQAYDRLAEALKVSKEQNMKSEIYKVELNGDIAQSIVDSGMDQLLGIDEDDLPF